MCKIRKILQEFIYIFTNYIVCNIPVWFIRKFFYRLLGMKIGKGSRILMKTIVVSPWRISIGEHTYINEYCYLDGRGGIHVGDNVTCAVYTKLITGYHDIHDNNFSYQVAPIEIEDHVAIFANSIILPGVTIKRNCVFSAMSLVKRGNYVADRVYAGNPAVKIGIRKSLGNYSQEGWNPVFR